MVVATLLVVGNIVTMIVAVVAGNVVAAAAAKGVAGALHHSMAAWSSHMGTLSLTYLLGLTNSH
jgi:uncharacterized protein YejL (UPF0352 family)